MNIALTKIYAATSANFCGRYSFARSLGLGCALALAGVGAAHAGPSDKDQREARQAAQAQPPAPAPRLQPQGSQPQRQAEPVRNDVRQLDAHAEEQRRVAQMQQDQNAHNAEAARRSGRLTPDERRDLRRQINEAGIDLYPNTPRR